MSKVVSIQSLIYAISTVFFLAGCSLDLEIISLGSKTTTPANLSINEADSAIVVNLANYTQKTISGKCPKDTQLEIYLDSNLTATTSCDSDQWAWTHNFTSIPDNDRIEFEIKTIATETNEQKSASAIILKDTVAPTLSSLQDINIPKLAHEIP